jgi:hypothetical protein
MMRKYLSVGVLALLLLMSVGAAFADMIPGSNNELLNSDFEKGLTDADPANWGAWLHGTDVGIFQYGVNNLALACKYPGQESQTWIRQVVDETLNPTWDWTKNWKEIDLMADIAWTGPPVDPHPTSWIEFKLDWWDMEHNGNPGDPRVQPADPPDYVVTSDPYYFGLPPGEWHTVNPFANDMNVLRDRNGNLIQPAWVSVEIVLHQMPGETIWVDNVILTGKCIPEPMSLVLGFMGLGSVAGLKRMFRK